VEAGGCSRFGFKKGILELSFELVYTPKRFDPDDYPGIRR
jgi:hypothetical protein